MGGTETELITRAVVISGSHILCVHRKTASNIFLPGGHIEGGEGAADSLRREIREELDTDCEIDAFLSTVEHSFVQQGNIVFEINLLFNAGIPNCHPGEDVLSNEDHLEFMWLACREEVLAEKNLQPWILQKYLPVYMETGTIPPFLSTAELTDPTGRD